MKDATARMIDNSEAASGPFELDADGLLEVLCEGEAAVLARMPNSSNVTLLVELTKAELKHRAIYKPVDGEQPLHDFQPGLHKREMAMYELDKALGFGVIPPTVVRDGPLGEGSFQAFVNADFSQHYFSLVEDGEGLDDLAKICAIDLIANNTDRKSGHCLAARDGSIFGIDNGLSFHAQFKLRTVIWGFVGEPLPEEMRLAIAKLAEHDLTALHELLDPFEIDALRTRSTALAELGSFPADDTGGRRYPWPLI